MKSAPDLGEVRKGSVQLPNLLPYEVEHVGTRAAARPPHLDDFLDLVEAEAESARPRDEGEDRQGVSAVDAVTRGGATGWRKNPSGLVQPQGLPAHAALRGYLADQQAVPRHAPTIQVAPWGKVKRKMAGHPEGALRALSARSRKLPSVTTTSPGLRPESTT